MAVSRSALEYLRRRGLIEDGLRPRPRLAIEDLKVHTVPLSSPPMPSMPVLQDFEGMPPPDRGASRPWPGQP